MSAHWLFLVLCGLSLAAEIQLNAPGQDLLYYFGGNSPQDQDSSPLCAAAITNTTVFLIAYPFTPNQVITPVPLPAQTTAAGIVCSCSTKNPGVPLGLWLGTATPDGTISWAFTGDCQTFQSPSRSYPFPGRVFNQAVHTSGYLPGLLAPGAVTGFAADDFFVEFVFGLNDQFQIGPKILDYWAWPSFSGTNHQVVGYAIGAPGAISGGQLSTGTARLISNDTARMGELTFYDENFGPSFRYFPNLRGWQAGVVPVPTAKPSIALSLVNPDEDNPNDGFILGFQPNAQPLSIDFPFPNSTTRWSTSIGNGFQPGFNGVAYATGVILLGQSTASNLVLRTVTLNGGSFVLNPTSTPVDQTSPSWISDTPVFIASIVEPTDPNNILFSAQRAAGPVIFQVPFPPTSSGEEVVVERNRRRRSSRVGASDCPTVMQCVVLGPPVCKTECCQNFQPSGSNAWVTACCDDCDVGYCGGNPASCSS